MRSRERPPWRVFPGVAATARRGFGASRAGATDQVGITTVGRVDRNDELVRRFMSDRFGITVRPSPLDSPRPEAGGHQHPVGRPMVPASRGPRWITSDCLTLTATRADEYGFPPWPARASVEWTARFTRKSAVAVEALLVAKGAEDSERRIAPRIAATPLAR